MGLCGPEFDGTVVVWVHPAGKASLFDQGGKLTPAGPLAPRWEDEEILFAGPAEIVARCEFYLGE